MKIVKYLTWIVIVCNVIFIKTLSIFAGRGSKTLKIIFTFLHLLTASTMILCLDSKLFVANGERIYILRTTNFHKHKFLHSLFIALFINHAIMSL